MSGDTIGGPSLKYSPHDDLPMTVGSVGLWGNNGGVSGGVFTSSWKYLLYNTSTGYIPDMMMR